MGEFSRPDSRLGQRIDSTLRHRFRRFTLGLTATGAWLIGSVSAGAQVQAPAVGGCTIDTLTIGFPEKWMGTTIGQISVRARRVDLLNPTVTTIAQYVHRSTRLNIVFNELSFTPGQLMDSVEVLESIRRLRRTNLMSEIILEGSQCAPGRTDFTLWTRDAWSLRTGFRFADAGSSRISVAEANLFGTARTINVSGDQIDDRRSISVTFADPYLFDTRMSGAVTLRNYPDGRTWYWNLRTRELSPRDVWRGGIASNQSRRLDDNPVARTHTDITRRDAAITVSRLLGSAPSWALAAIGGVESEFANINVVRPGTVLGKTAVRRDLTAPLVGLSVRSNRFGSVNWLVPMQPAAEVPLGLAGEAVVGVGRDIVTGSTMTHFDSWVGATEMPRLSTIITGDLWTSGYWSADSVSAGTVRASLAFYQQAWNGMWILRATSERLYNPDPDVFALATVDAALHTLAPKSRVAERALNVSLERSMHLVAHEGRWALDGALTASYSSRDHSVDEVSMTPTNPQVLIVGIGLRHIRNQPTQAPLRLDIGRAVWRSAGLPNRWIIGLSTVAWINSGRTRDGVRDVSR